MPKGVNGDPPWPHREAHLVCVRIDASYHSPNGFLGPEKPLGGSQNAFLASSNFFSIT
jgi:hypothetical protein